MAGDRPLVEILCLTRRLNHPEYFRKTIDTVGRHREDPTTQTVEAVTVKPMIVIDPGAAGGIAYRDSCGDVELFNMPEGMSEQIDLIRELRSRGHDVEALIENVGGYVPGNSAPAAVKFSRHIGNLEGALFAFAIPTSRVAPGVWQKKLGTFSKDKQERKRQIKELVARLHPDLSVTLKTSDALGMLVWATK